MINCYRLKFTRFAGLCAFFVLITSMLYAQRHTTARNMALGGGGTAYITDFHANFINPANLMLGDHNVTLGMFGGFSTRGGGELANLAIYNEYFTTGRTINEDLTVEISNKLFGVPPNGSRKVGINADFVLMGFNIKTKNQAFSTALRMRALSSFSISKGFFELSLGGLNELYFNEYKDVNVSGDVLLAAEASVGYAREVWSSGNFGESGSKRLFAGIAPKLLMGLDYYSTSFNSQLRISEDEMMMSHIFSYQLEAVGKVSEQMNNFHTDRNSSDLEPVFGEYLAFDEAVSELASVKGTGLGLDLGVTYEMVMPSLPLLGGHYQTLKVSLSATDLGSVNFDQDPGRFSANGHFEWQGLNADFERINAEFDSSFADYASHIQDSIGTNVYGGFGPENISGIKVGMSPMVNLGAAYSAGRWNFVLDLGKGLNDRGMNSKSISGAFGVEYNLFNIIPLRAGFRSGGELNTAVSLGTGLNLKFMDFAVGVMTSPSPLDSTLHFGAAWSGLVVRF